MTKALVSIARKILTEIALVGAVSIIVIVVLQAVRRPTVMLRPGLSMKGSLVAVGSPVEINSVQFSKRQLTLLLVSSPYCHFCLASKNFHKHLLAEAESHGIPVFLSVPDRASSATYAGDFHLSPGRLKEWKDLSVHVEGTPTLVAINSSGVVTQLWIGELPPPEETAVLDLVRSAPARSAAATPALQTIDDFPPETVKATKPSQKLDIIDVRERSEILHLQEGAVNIPLQELPFRAQDEIPANTLHLVDCRGITPELCDRGVQILKREGFRVGTLGRGTYHASSCRTTALGNADGN